MVLEKWFVSINGMRTEKTSISELLEYIDEFTSLETCSIWVGRDGGPRPWWHRLFGTQARYVDSLLTIEWHGHIALLIFYDENWSEYRVVDKDNPVYASDAERLKVSHGEKTAPSNEECLGKDRALAAVREFLRNGNRPEWLQYRFVA